MFLFVISTLLFATAVRPGFAAWDPQLYILHHPSVHVEMSSCAGAPCPGDESRSHLSGGDVIIAANHLTRQESACNEDISPHPAAMGREHPEPAEPAEQLLQVEPSAKSRVKERQRELQHATSKAALDVGGKQNLVPPHPTNPSVHVEQALCASAPCQDRASSSSRRAPTIAADRLARNESTYGGISDRLVALRRQNAKHLLEVVRSAENQEEDRQRKLRRATKYNLEYLEKR